MTTRTRPGLPPGLSIPPTEPIALAERIRRIGRIPDFLRPATDGTPGRTEAWRLREIAGPNPRIVADELGVSRQAVAAWESGTSRPSPDLAVRWVAFLEQIEAAEHALAEAS